MVVIFFNVKEARDYLLKHRFVYTLRKERAAGLAEARTGSYYKFKSLGPVKVIFVTRFTSLEPSKLRLYEMHSGFLSAEKWLDAAHQLKNGLNDVDCLYRVEMVD